MKIIDATYRDHVGPITNALCNVSREKVDALMAQDIAKRFVQRAYDYRWRERKGYAGMFSACLVAPTEESDIHGYLYAEERIAFDCVHGLPFVEVHHLVGRNCAVPLLEELKRRTRKRILLAHWSILSNRRAFERLLRPLNPQQMAAIYQL